MKELLIISVVINAIILLILLFKNQNSQFQNFDKSIREEISSGRQETNSSLKNFGESISSQFIGLTRLNEDKFEAVRNSVENRLKSLQEENSKKLEEMRLTVDEKLHTTLENRLNNSFKLVSDRLEQVQKGLGEMQNLASGVGDLKKVLTNVKTRGTWGEIQLGNLLEQLLTIEQYSKNVVTKKGSRENVEFAIKLPGKGDDVVWIPIDSKFPKEDYERLIDAQEKCDVELVEKVSKDLESRVKSEAKDIRDKYIDPPHTTDFGILFLATEGLYAEILRRPGLCSFIQKEYRVIITGPTTISALLNSLQMGFRTLAIEKRASDVWNLLGVVKSEFSKFGDMLEKTDKQLTTVRNTIGEAARKSRTIESKLKKVQELPASDNPKLLINTEDISLDLDEEDHEA